MNKIALGCILAVAAVGAGAGMVAARHIPTIKPNTYVGGVAVGGLTLDEAGVRVRQWWETEKKHPLKLVAPDLTQPLPDETPGQLGVTVDDVASVASLPTDDIAGDVLGAVSQTPPDRKDFPFAYKPNGFHLGALAADVKVRLKKATLARATFEKGGAIFTTKEVPAQELDVAAVPQAVMTALLGQKTEVAIPFRVSPKHVPDDALASISDVVSSFSTRFSAGNRPRASNIRLASSKLNGVVLMPGDVLTFNGTVGRRTLRAGFKLAGVYKNGKHDVGIGGGICQVSTTLYNACLLGDLKIRQRSNHSLPVPYVPLGRDATVDYGSLDLIVQNSYPTPIAIVSAYQPGRLTFRVLGKKDPSLSVKIIQSHAQSWDPGESLVVDHSLRPGAKKVIEPGNWGHTVTMYRLVFHDGTLASRERLGRSTYGGHERIVAYNPAPKAAVAAPVIGTPVAQPPAGIGH